jgi:hypothetical protein
MRIPNQIDVNHFYASLIWILKFSSEGKPRIVLFDGIRLICWLVDVNFLLGLSLHLIISHTQLIIDIVIDLFLMLMTQINVLVVGLELLDRLFELDFALPLLIDQILLYLFALFNQFCHFRFLISLKLFHPH